MPAEDRLYGPVLNIVGLGLRLGLGLLVLQSDYNATDDGRWQTGTGRRPNHDF